MEFPILLLFVALFGLGYLMGMILENYLLPTLAKIWRERK